MGGKQSKERIPGVVYSEDWVAPDPDQFRSWRGAMFHVRPDRLPKGMQEGLDVEAQVSKPGPEEEPYTFWEKIGAVPVAIARVRPRQYYHPTTDFTKYSYDEQSPEEIRLRAQWMARMYEYGWSYPATAFCICSAMCIPLPFRVRLPMMCVVSISVVFMEFQRVYTNSAREKEMLDDFLVAKEIWYIKNVEAVELGVDLLPEGMNGLDAIKERDEDERKFEEMQMKLVKGGMTSTGQPQQSPPVYRGPGLENADGSSVASPAVYIGEPGMKRPGQVNASRPGMLGVNASKRLPDLPV